MSDKEQFLKDQRRLLAQKLEEWDRQSAGGSQNNSHAFHPDSLPHSLGDYTLLRLQGVGGMGSVYEAVHDRLEKKVAIKVLPANRTSDAGSVERFIQEMRAIGKLSHPNIIQALDAREENDFYFLVLEYVEGADLQQLMQSVGAIEIADACEMVRQAANGLMHASQHQIVHRDIKPANLFFAIQFDPNQNIVSVNIKILDLGLARFSDVTKKEELTVTGQLIGTYDYMPPEQIQNSRAVDIRSDLYSLGCTLYFLLIGKTPFADSKGSFRKMKAHEESVPVLVNELREEIPAQLAAIVSTLLEKSPDARYSTPAELIEAITPFCKGANFTKLADRYLANPAPSITTTNLATNKIVLGDTDSIKSIEFADSAEKKQIRSEGNSKPWLGSGVTLFLVAVAVFGVVFGLLQLFDGASSRPKKNAEGAMEFDGIDDFIETKFRYSDSSAITFEAWVTPQKPPTPRKMALICNAESSGISLILDKEMKPVFKFHVGFTYLIHSQSMPIPVGKQSHIAAIYDGISLAVFVNGKLQGSRIAVRNPHHPSPLRIYIAANPDPKMEGREKAGFRNLFVGTMAGIRFSKGAIYPEDTHAPQSPIHQPETLFLLDFKDANQNYLVDASNRLPKSVVYGNTTRME